ncbi:MAG: hypothetical protein A3G38_01475 [Omnitrophica WOR_2 bacterium RIFCSPLOWO2_12_FULL_51_8]|nr:MAG: hypothetical protein A3G38_01475 [Omnitrophica WOR_2 bacterium RIFCSPLOWO2_12_FULL_51_8]
MTLSLFILDFVIIAAAWLLSCHLFLGPQSLSDYLVQSRLALPVLYLCKISFFTKMGLYRAILRYASFHFGTTIVKAVSVGSALAYLIINYPSMEWPIGLLLMDWFITLFLVGVARFFPRYYAERTVSEAPSDLRRVLIYGAGDLGDAVARSLLRERTNYNPVGFIDDDIKKTGKKVHNLPVLGNRSSLTKIIKRQKVRELIVAITTVPSDWLRDLIKECRTQNVFCRIAPKMSDMLSHEVAIKNIDITDLLKRDPKDLDEKQIDRFLRRKKILITGAAGSIGAELVRQALRFRPKKIVAVDISEYGLYKLEEELAEIINEKRGYSKLKFCLLDLCQKERLEQLVGAEKPDLIFHAAAYKHVPMLEANPFSAVLNNLQSTLNISDAADRHGVEKLVLISSDKAVRPTNIMGATKRICELYVQNLNMRSQTDFLAVRFGNVLGSSGSVVPKFLEQIGKGGPVTVTHPEITRYFMLVSEAVQLVMQAASIGHGGEIFILNMGKPVKIREMAENLIFLTGKTPYEDIDIRYTGLRPGEKLYEELLINEAEKKTQYETITIGRTTFINWEVLNFQINSLIRSSLSEDKLSLFETIKLTVPEFAHVELVDGGGEQKIFPIGLKKVASLTSQPSPSD